MTCAALSSPIRGGLGPGLDGGAHAADVAADHHADNAAVKLDDRAGNLNPGRLEHRVNRAIRPTRPSVSMRPSVLPFIDLELPSALISFMEFR